MNQRSKRASDRKRGQDIGASVMNTGGHVASHRRGSAPVVRTPQKTTGDVSPEKLLGAAKASPAFKELKETAPISKTEEKKVIAKATEEVIKKKAPETKNKKDEKNTD